MNQIFADTFYWVALTDPNDSLYKEATRLDERLSETRIVTSDEVLSEFLTFFSANAWMRRRAARTVYAIEDDDAVEIVPQTRESFRRGFELYVARHDKRYSLVDCISMQTMKRKGITEVLTNDRHFEQEGFRVLFDRRDR